MTGPPYEIECPPDKVKMPLDGDNSAIKNAFVDEFLDSVSMPGSALNSRSERATDARSTDVQLEKGKANSTQADFKFEGKLLLIGGASHASLEFLDPLVAILPRGAKVVAVGLASEDAEALVDCAKDLRDAGGIKPENITILTDGEIPRDSEFRWSKDLPDKFDMIYFGGGKQLLLKNRFTQVDKLRTALQNGAIVAGNSAGTAIMPSEMITGGDAAALTHGEGFSLLPWAITDTHVHQRQREDRDITALYDIGKGKIPVIGIDEDTSVLFSWKGGHLVGEVAGANSVRIFKMTDQELKLESKREVKAELIYGTDGASKGKAALVWELKAGDKFILR